MPSYPYTWKTSDFSMEIGETVTITLNFKNINQSIPIFEDGVQIGTTTTNTYDYTPTSNGTHILHYFNTNDCRPLTVTVTGGGIVSGNDTTTLNGALTELGETIADNLTSMGVTASANDGLTTLANKVLQISGGGGQEIVSFDNLTTEFNYTQRRGNYGFSVTIPNGVTSLGAYCFSSCPGLISITIPSSVTSLGTYCFSGCTSLTNVDIPSNVTSLESYCFNNCTGLTSITIPSGVTSLPSACFYNCTGLTNVDIPSGVTSLKSSCFNGCKGLTNIDIPSNVTSLESYCFSNCRGLTNVNIPSNVTSLGTYCFRGCTGLISITIPSGVTSLGNRCFYGCTKLVDYQLYWENPPITWSSDLMPNNKSTIFTIPNGTTANYTATNFPSDKLVERSV